MPTKSMEIYVFPFNNRALDVYHFFPELQFRIVMVQKGMSPPDSPQKHRSDKSNYRATPNKSAPAVSSQNANAERSQSIRGKGIYKLRGGKILELLLH